MPVTDGSQKCCGTYGAVTKVLLAVAVVAIASVTTIAWLRVGAWSVTESSNGIGVATISTGTDRLADDHHSTGAPRPQDRLILQAPERAATDRPATNRRSSDRSATDDRPEMVARLSAAGWLPSVAVAVRDDRRPRYPEGRTPQLALRDRPTKRIDHQWFWALEDRDENGDKTGTDDVGAQTWQNVGTRPTNHYEYPITGTVKWNDDGPVTGLGGHRDSYDLNANDYSYIADMNKQLLTDEPIGGGGGNELHRDDGVQMESHYSTVHEDYPVPMGSGSAPTAEHRPQSTRSEPAANHRPSSPHAYSPGADHYTANVNSYYPDANDYGPPPPRTTTAVTVQQYPGAGNAVGGPQPKIMVPVVQGDGKVAAVDWKTIAALALVKLVLVKLKAFAAINVLVFLLVGVKLLLMAVSLKFLLLLKFVKFVKIVALPLIILPLLAAIVTSVFPFARTLQSMVNNALPAAQPGFLSAPTTIRPVIASQSTSSVLRPGGSTILPGALRPGGSTILPGALRPGSSTIVQGGPTRFPGQFVPADLRSQSAFELGDLNSALYGRHYQQSLKARDPTLDVFRELLSSEKCVERIACRMAVAEKAGIFPSWINWILSGVSEVISNEKLKLYFKAYNDINNNVLTNSTNADSWVPWCLEHYDCNL